MCDTPFVTLLKPHLYDPDEQFKALAKKLRLPISVIEQWFTGEAVPEDAWQITTAAKVLQISAVETDLLLMAAGFEQVGGTQKSSEPVQVTIHGA